MKIRITERKRIEMVANAIDNLYGKHVIFEVRTTEAKKGYDILAGCVDQEKVHTIGRFLASVHGDLVKIVKVSELVEKAYIDTVNYYEADLTGGEA